MKKKTYIAIALMMIVILCYIIGVYDSIVHDDLCGMTVFVLMALLLNLLRFYE